jgi:hypothetical protein
MLAGHKLIQFLINGALMTIEANCRATMIGSMPHQNVDVACRIILKNLPEIPVWPQLPAISFKENMYVQYTEGMPAIVVDEENEKVFFDTSKDIVPEVERVYERFLADDIEYFAVSRDYSRGLHALLSILAKQPPGNLILIKGQITGPVSFGLTVPDSDKKPVYYHEILSDVVQKTLAMKAKWQERKFKELIPGADTLIFFDEPYLTSFGSAYINVSREDIVESLREVKSFLEGLTGVHCCGRTDWTLFTESGVDVISFDAYDYAESLALYPLEVKSFLEKGGILAWGIVPSSFPGVKQVDSEDVNSLARRLEDRIQLLAEKGIDKEVILRSALITPNCGTASMSVDQAEKAIELTRLISEKMRAKYFEG